MKKYPILTFILGLALLIILQKEAIMPLVYKVIQSELFLVDTEDTGVMAPVSTPLTNLAFFHCNNHIKSKFAPSTVITFPDKPLYSWSLGGYQYLINAEVSVSKDNQPAITAKYACRISYKNGKNEEGSQDFDNWSIDGLSGLENL